jgi:glycosyltransferase involved in cell wall biosynthesis
VPRPDRRSLRVAFTVEQCWQPVPGGSGSYVIELGRDLDARPDVELVGLAARHGGPPVVEPTTAVRHARVPRPVLYEAWNRLRRPRAESHAGPVDLVHATTWAVPGRRVPLVVTVHDLAFLRAPEQFTRRGNQFFRRAWEVVRDEAVRVVVPSEATRADCLAHGLPEDRLRVVPHGVRVPDVAPEQVSDLRRRLGLERGYVLWCGTLEPRKNLPRLLEAFARLAPEQPDLDLVLVGPTGWGGAAERVQDALARLPQGRVHVAGRLSEPDLHAAYAGARAFAFPSTWEGFGMPVLEAMAHGVPVVTSAGTSMEELVGEGGLVADPADPDAIAAALLDAVGQRHAVLADGARAAVAGRTWAAAAAATRTVYEEALRA